MFSGINIKAHAFIVLGPVLFGNNQLGHFFADDLAARVAKSGLSAVIIFNKVPLTIDDNHRIHRRIERFAQLAFIFL